VLEILVSHGAVIKSNDSIYVKCIQS